MLDPVARHLPAIESPTADAKMIRRSSSPPSSAPWHL